MHPLEVDSCGFIHLYLISSAQRIRAQTALFCTKMPTEFPWHHCKFPLPWHQSLWDDSSQFAMQVCIPRRRSCFPGDDWRILFNRAPLPTINLMEWILTWNCCPWVLICVLLEIRVREKTWINPKSHITSTILSLAFDQFIYISLRGAGMLSFLLPQWGH